MKQALEDLWECDVVADSFVHTRDGAGNAAQHMQP